MSASGAISQIQPFLLVASYRQQGGAGGFFLPLGTVPHGGGGGGVEFFPTVRGWDTLYTWDTWPNEVLLFGWLAGEIPGPGSLISGSQICTPSLTHWPR